MTKFSIPLYFPLNTLKEIDENIWIVDGGMIEMAALVTKIPFSTRMTVIKLANGQLWCHSPIAPNDDLFQALDQIGQVKYLISPNKIHYAYIADWKKRYPNAIAWASPGVEKRAWQQKIATAFDKNLSDQAPVDWSDEIEQFIFKGSYCIEEVVFFHKSSQTLILVDLIENFEVEKFSSLVRKKLYQFVGIGSPDGQTPLDYRLTFLGRKALAKSSFERLLAWKPQKIILAHGKIYLENAEIELKRALRWAR